MDLLVSIFTLFVSKMKKKTVFPILISEDYIVLRKFVLLNIFFLNVVHLKNLSSNLNVFSFSVVFQTLRSFVFTVK